MESPILGLINLISDVSALTQEEQEHLIKTYKNLGKSSSEREKAREKLILSNVRLVINIAKNFVTGAIPLVDLISEGTIGLMTAIEKFDPRKGYQLSTYASWWIRQRILRYIMNNRYLIRVPEHVIEKINRLRRGTEEFFDKFDREPDEDELEEIARSKKFKLKRYLGAIPSITSLENGGFGDPHSEPATLHEKIASGEDLVGRLLDNLAVKQMFSYLDEKERTVISLRYGIEISRKGEIVGAGEFHTLDESAKSLNVSRERVRQIEKSALRKLRKKFSGESQN